VLAAYLAFVAGFVNSAGFVLMGSFTSHVTGTVGRLGNDLAVHDSQAAAFALLLIFAFFVGAFAASLILASGFRDMSTAYGTALLVEGVLIAAFILVAGTSRTLDPRVLDLQAAILCAAMGMQNSMVTRLSGAVIRTTHLTGVITDLGIETAQWYRWLRTHTAEQRASAPPGDTRARLGRTLLLLAITVAFTAGAVAGVSLTFQHGRWAVAIPTLLLFAASAYAFFAQPAPRPEL
jgi:uncharacterized membrane protein YoaK (UPF0700 family)